MKTWIVVVAAVAASVLPAVAQDVAGMPAWERESYLEACLIVKDTDPMLATFQRVGTGAVTRGHATVAMIDTAQGRSGQLECSFATLAEPGAPTAETLVVKYAGGGQDELDVAAANATLAEHMQ